MLCACQILGNGSEFRRAVGLTLDHLTFDRNTTVQVFEATIRYTTPSLTLALTLTLTITSLALALILHHPASV